MPWDDHAPTKDYSWYLNIGDDESASSQTWASSDQSQAGSSLQVDHFGSNMESYGTSMVPSINDSPGHWPAGSFPSSGAQSHASGLGSIQDHTGSLVLSSNGEDSEFVGEADEGTSLQQQHPTTMLESQARQADLPSSADNTSNRSRQALDSGPPEAIDSWACKQNGLRIKMVLTFILPGIHYRPEEVKRHTPSPNQLDHTVAQTREFRDDDRCPTCSRRGRKVCVMPTVVRGKPVFKAGSEKALLKPNTRCLFCKSEQTKCGFGSQ